MFLLLVLRRNSVMSHIRGSTGETDLKSKIVRFEQKRIQTDKSLELSPLESI